MKALCLSQPYADWVVAGIKTLETRKWMTKHRGPLLIVATQMKSKTWAPALELEYAKLPVGKAIGVVEVVNCRVMEPGDENAARCLIYPRARAWELKNARRLEAPFPVKGQLGIFEVQVPESVDGLK